MELHLTARHCKLNSDEHAAATEAAKNFAKFYDGIVRVDAVFDEATHKSCEYTVRVQGHTIVARESAENFFTAIHEASHKVVRQLRKLKTKMSFTHETVRA